MSLNIPWWCWALFGVGVSLIIFSGVILQIMIGQVNRLSTTSDRISPFFDYPGKQLLIVRRYKKLFPNGRLHIAFNVCAIIGIGLCAAAFFGAIIFR
jgi:preprotein translocase subunit SecY